MPRLTTIANNSARAYGFNGAAPVDMTVTYLTIAGGGAGGGWQAVYGGAGGGAGGYIESTFLAETGTTYTVAIGAGGAAVGENARGGAGGNTTLTGATTVIGGGGGGGYDSPSDGGNGGSGGGSSYKNSGTATPGTGTSGQGNRGGNGVGTYFGGFTFSINGSNAVTGIAHQGNGWGGSIVADKFKIGNLGNTNYFKGTMHQVAIWDTNEFSNLATIYNSGATQDLSALSSSPAHIYEMGSSITTVTDLVGSANLTPFGFTIASVVTDAP